MRFVDEVEIEVQSGRGGNGMVSFRREKFVPRGGPDGGDGGRGGDVTLTADPGLKTLLDYRYRQHYRAGDGAPGGGSRKKGKAGERLILRVPVGTLVWTVDGELLADLAEAGQSIQVARGGRAGLGNSHFALPWRQAPDVSRPGGDGQSMQLRLELKLLADVGLVGLPNAGKSTLINRISAAKARVAGYPFTTLVPNLGVVAAGTDRSFVVADLPGLIEGAAGGAGLGLQFLRHVERTRVLAHLVDCSATTDPTGAFRMIEKELARYGDGIADKAVIVVASKIELPDSAESVAKLRRFAKRRNLPFFAVSSMTHQGIDELVKALTALVFADTVRS